MQAERPTTARTRVAAKTRAVVDAGAADAGADAIAMAKKLRSTATRRPHRAANLYHRSFSDPDTTCRQNRRSPPRRRPNRRASKVRATRMTGRGIVAPSVFPMSARSRRRPQRRRRRAMSGRRSPCPRPRHRDPPSRRPYIRPPIRPYILRWTHLRRRKSPRLLKKPLRKKPRARHARAGGSG